MDTPSVQTVLLVEPDSAARIVLADYLRGCGYKVIEATTYEDALTVLQHATDIDIVFSEVKLPGPHDGFHLAQHVRAQYPNTDVILSSSESVAAKKADDLCGHGPLEKPYHPEEVVRKIRQLRSRLKSA